jgi:DNA polymerase I-like protein with 3'-5' exonuclease and polymerase domains
VLESGEDLHRVTAQEVFEVTAHQWGELAPTQQLGMRNYAKSFRYRLAYGGDPDQVGALGAKNFCPCPRCALKAPPTVNLPPGSITRAGQRFLANRPEIDRWRTTMMAEVREHRCLTLVGRKRYFFGPLSGLKREVYNFPIQFLAAWRINRAMRSLHSMGAPLVMQLHDNLMVEVPLGEAPVWAERMEGVMAAPVPELGGVGFPVDVGLEAPWGVERVQPSRP